MLESLLINILFLIFPIVLFVIFFNDYNKKSHLMLIYISICISMILCMAFPIKLEAGFIVDLRYVPFIIAALYGGYKGVFPLYVTLNIYRLIIGGEGLIQSFIWSTSFLILLPMLSTKFLNYNKCKRIIFGTVISLMNVIVYLIALRSYFEVLNKEYWTVAFYYLCTSGLTMAITLIMIEKIKSNIKKRELFYHAEKLHVMSELSASVSHEIRNPLTVTKGFLQLLGVSKTISQKDQVYVDYSLKELVRAETILNDYLAFAKPQSIHMVHADLKEDMEYVKNILTPFAKFNNVDITYQFSNSLKRKYDQNQMKQCLINLLKNAIESMKEEGGILSIHVFEQSQNMVIRLEDEGIGMTKQEILQLGKPFYSTKTEGIGLGMMMVYGTISKLNGEVEVQSKKGKGTTFTITIPT